jgi:hypothetical protein
MTKETLNKAVEINEAIGDIEIVLEKIKTDKNFKFGYRRLDVSFQTDFPESINESIVKVLQEKLATLKEELERL